MNVVNMCKCILHRPARAAACLAATVLVACGGGGGGGEAPVAQAVVLSVASADVLEGQGGLQSMVLTVTLDKAPVAASTIRYFTTSTAKAGITNGAGSATGGAACGPGVDYLQASQGSPASVTIPAGAQVVAIPVKLICGDTDFEPNETFTLNWTAGAHTGSVLVTIVNDDAGGLNSPGVATVLGGAAAFGRDTGSLTNSNADGALGFAFADTTSGGCRADLVTGLTWGTIDIASYTQSAAAAQVAAANAGGGMCGFTDWRVPGVEELASLVDHSRSVAPVNADLNGAGTQMAGLYWSNDGSVGAINDQMVVDFTGLGVVGVQLKTQMAHVRLVRGTGLGDPCDNSRYTDHGDGTVSDAKTGLMWKQCSEGLGGAACATGTAFATAVAGNTDAVTRLGTVNANAATLGLGYADWRIPSRNELASLVCRSAVAAPLINTTLFPATDPVSYLSSTPHASPGASWFVDFQQQGSVGATSNAGKRLRLVRAGQ